MPVSQPYSSSGYCNHHTALTHTITTSPHWPSDAQLYWEDSMADVWVIPWQTAPAAVWAALPLGCPGSPVGSWPSSSSEPQSYTPAGRLSPRWCTMQNQDSRGLRGERDIISGVPSLDWEADTPPSRSTSGAKTDKRGAGLTVDDMLRRYGLLVGLVAYFISFWGDEVYELRAAVHHQLPGIVCHSYVRESFLDHLVDRCSGDCEVVVVSRGRSHRGIWPQAKPVERRKALKDRDWPCCVDGLNVLCVCQTSQQLILHQVKRRFPKVSLLAILSTKLIS